jgi:hypothetical protein
MPWAHRQKFGTTSTMPTQGDKPGFVVKRTRVDDSRYSTEQKSPHIGEVRYSKVFAKREQAEAEARAWESDGSWKTEIVT